ncbi:testis development-related protein [Engraulis encrasicolus]|uniref:testis development-related protein n=1 Tax=Engraulis encrasicolus TaxID=184585 RepID=UPI002FD2167C
MFKKSKSQVLVDYASEEDDMSWHHLHSYKDKEQEGVEETLSPPAKEMKVKKIKSKKDRKDKKLDDEHFLLTGAVLSDKKGKSKDEERGGGPKPAEREKEKGDKRFWDSIATTMRQITPNRKMDRMEGWEPPRLSLPGEPEGEQPGDENSDQQQLQQQQQQLRTNSKKDVVAVSSQSSSPPSILPLSSPALTSPLSSPLSLALPSWRAGVTLEDWRYASLADCTTGSAVRWAAKARGKLAAGIRRRSHGSVSENMWEGLK